MADPAFTDVDAALQREIKALTSAMARVTEMLIELGSEALCAADVLKTLNKLDDGVAVVEGSLVNRRGHSIFMRRWSAKPLAPNEQPEKQGFVLVIHGYGEHSGRYNWVASQYAHAGLDVFAIDLTGHGRSVTGGAFGEGIESFEALVDDAEDLFRYTCLLEDTKDLPFFICGHSMGGALAFHLARRLQDIPGLMCPGHSCRMYKGSQLLPRGRGVILSAPAFRVAGNILAPAPYNPFYRGIARMLTAVAPNMPSPGVSADDLTCSPEMNAAASADPLGFGDTITAHNGNELVKLGLAATEVAPSLHTNMLFLHGEADKIAYMSGSRGIFDAVASIDKRLCVYPGLKHEILQEPAGRGAVMDDILPWIASRIFLYTFRKAQVAETDAV